MNAYLFSAGVAYSQMTKEAGTDQMGGLEMINRPREWEACADFVIVAETPEQAREKLENRLNTPSDDGVQGRIKKIVAAQFIDQLLTESGNQNVDWPALCQRVTDHLLATQADGLEQGYWVDMNDLDSVTRAAMSLEGLQAALPEDIRDNLNWSPEKTFFFIISILDDAPNATTAKKEHHPSLYNDDDETASNPGDDDAGEMEVAFPELVERKAATLVEARNSVIAAWLWQQYCAPTPLAQNPIQISPWWGAIS